MALWLLATVAFVLTVIVLLVALLRFASRNETTGLVVSPLFVKTGRRATLDE
jgi:hypothetical protein